MAGVRAPKQWSLTKVETITSFEAWRQNLQYTLSLDPNFAGFIIDGFVWQKKTNAQPLRGFVDDGEEVAEANRRTAAQKCTHLDLMLGQIANYCPVISRNTIIKNSTSINNIWQSIRLHFGFQSTGGHFLDFNNIHLEANERPEDLYQRLASFVEDNLLHAGGNISHHGEIPEADEELSPSLENFIVLTWLRLIHRDLPNLVKQRYGTDLRSQTLASLKPEISLALDSLLDEIHTATDSKILRASLKDRPFKKTFKQNHQNKHCVLCKQAGRPHQHFLSTCKFLPDEDKRYMSRVRQSYCNDTPGSDIDSECEGYENLSCNDSEPSKLRVVSALRRVSTKKSPFFKAFYKQFPLQLTLDTGAEVSMVKASSVNLIGVPIKKSNHTALQADGITPLDIVGECHFTLCRDGIELQLEALVVNDLDVDILAGIPFMSTNDIAIYPSKHKIVIRDQISIHYGSQSGEQNPNSQTHVRRTQAFLIRAPDTSSVIWPGCYGEFNVPKELDQDGVLAVEPDSSSRTFSWPDPHITEAVAGKIRILNNTSEPQRLQKNEHFCRVRAACTVDTNCKTPDFIPDINKKAFQKESSSYNPSDQVSIDPDNLLSPDFQTQFRDLVSEFSDVFDPNFKGYNGAVGPFKASVNMGPVQPPQRKGRVPQYSKDKLVELQDKFDELECKGVFQRPEDLGISVEYINPSFLVKKSSGGYRLVTAFADVGRYSKPQPSLLPDVDSTLRSVAQWKYIIKSDLTSAFYQIPLAKESMKYCGVATPYRGVRVYTRCAMGMPGSETALEELMCRILGDFLQEGCVAKLADDLFCGGNTPSELIQNWKRVLKALQRSGICLSPTKTIICPKSINILGWIWSQGSISASPHRVAALASCSPPENVRGLRSFIGAYKMLSRVLPHCSHLISPLDDHISGLTSLDKVKWTDTLLEQFNLVQKSLESRKSVVLPRRDDQLWIVTDGSVTKRGIGATLYVLRDEKLKLAGFFSAKLRKHQVLWLPCEVEALSIAASVKHFSPFIIQSQLQANILTDSKPCVQGFEKLCRGEFSASPRVTSFLSIVSRYQVSIRHLAGRLNIPSDFASRNAPPCNEPNCQICSFISRTEDSVVRSVNIKDVMSDDFRLPFTSRSAWIDIQSQCPDLRRTHAHLKQGTRPSKKLTNIKDVKRYLSVATIAKDGLLVVRRCDPLAPPSESIIVPRNVLDGLVTALHIKLEHPTKHQLNMVLKRQFYALDLPKIVEQVSDSCHTCASLKRFPKSLIEQSSEDPPDIIGISFAADVLKRNRQLILVVRETVTSYTSTCFINDEKRDTLRDALIRLLVALKPLNGPNVVVRVDPAPGFRSLQDDPFFKQFNISIEVGRVKNPNKNPVAEKAIAELEDEILREERGESPISELSLSVATARLNSRLRQRGLSSRELWTQRNQFTHEQLPISDMNVICTQHDTRVKNHGFSETSKCKKPSRPSQAISIGDLVYLYSDRSKTQSRSRYLVVSLDGDWCFIKKFVGNQLRASSYKVKLTECYKVPITNIEHNPSVSESDTDDSPDSEPNHPPDIPPQIPQPLDVVGPIPEPPPGHVEVPPLLVYEGEPNQNAVAGTPLDPPIDQDKPSENIYPPKRVLRKRNEIKPPSHLKDYIVYK